MREVPVGGGTRPGTQIPLRLIEVEPRLPNEVDPGRNGGDFPLEA